MRPETGFPGGVVVRGAGSIGSRHVRVLGQLGVDPVLAWPVRPGGDRPELGGARVVADVDEALTAGARAAVIATDTSRHGVDAAAFMDAALPLLVEKPLARDAGEARLVADAAHRSGSPLSVAAPLRFHESLQRARAVLPELGDIHSVSVWCQSYLPAWRPGQDLSQSYSARPGEGGVLRDLVHEIDYALWLFGRPDVLSAVLTPGDRLGIPVEAGADLLWRVPTSGTTVRLRLDYLSRPATRGMSVYGAAGTLHWDAIGSTVTLLSSTGAERTETFPDDLDRDVVMGRQASAFLRAATGEAGAGAASAEDGVAALAVCDAARVSATGREVPVVAA